MDKLISYTIFEAFKEVKAFTTFRQTFSGDKAPRFTGNFELKISENRRKLAEILGITSERLVFPHQTHTSCVSEIYGFSEEEPEGTDALVTNRPDICLCVQTADCVPILLFDPKRKTIAAIHAGWRGTVKRIAGKAVQKLKAVYQTSPEDIRAVIGPSIGPEAYEVGNEVVDAVLENIPNALKTLHKKSSEKYHFNLWEANRQILHTFGVLNQNIETFGECTFQESEKFFSARREGVETGRLVSGIMLKQRI